MMNDAWFKEFPAAISICDAQGILLDMNAAAEEVFAEDGGRNLIGSNILDCHPEPARSRLVTMLKDHQPNAYTIEKQGRKKLIYQAPWYDRGRFSGFVEISLEIPVDLPHYVRD